MTKEFLFRGLLTVRFGCHSADMSFFPRSWPKPFPSLVSWRNPNGVALGFSRAVDGSITQFTGKCLIFFRCRPPFSDACRSQLRLTINSFLQIPQTGTPHSSLSSSSRNGPPKRTCRPRIGSSGAWWVQEPVWTLAQVEGYLRSKRPKLRQSYWHDASDGLLDAVFRPLVMRFVGCALLQIQLFSYLAKKKLSNNYFIFCPRCGLMRGIGFLYCIFFPQFNFL